MSRLHETAYPRLKAVVTDQELAEIYTLSAQERSFAGKHGRTPAARGALLILLKTMRLLGYFVHLKAVPQAITTHILACDDLSHFASSQLRGLRPHWRRPSADVGHGSSTGEHQGVHR
ncbi:DUF4158 domain-containing protein [Halomonas sp. CSM-2]|uniref:DUF4158 domain-containing protein n=1 Tax=Halomonas sp. CSM-2 TaxID=1975722 RepID=UPI001C395C61